MKAFEAVGGELLACRICLKSRQLADNSTCLISTIVDCVNLMVWADKTVIF